MPSVYHKSRQTSQAFVQDSRHNPYLKQNASEFSPQKSNKSKNTSFSNKKKVKQVANKIKQVLNLCENQNQETANQFEHIINAERRILDQLVDATQIQGFPTQNVSYPNSTGFNCGYPTGGGTNGIGFKTFENQNSNGNQGYSQNNINQQRLPQSGVRSIKNRISQSDMNRLGDDTVGLIDQIQRIALLEIQSLKAEKMELFRKLNGQIKAHNEQKRRRAWLQAQFMRILTLLQQQGFKIGPIQYPEWYFQSNYSSNQLSNDYIQFPQQNFNQPYQQYKPQSPQHKPISPNQGLMNPHQVSQQSPSFASQNQTQIYDQQGLLINQQNGQQQNYYPNYGSQVVNPDQNFNPNLNSNINPNLNQNGSQIRYNNFQQSTQPINQNSQTNISSDPNIQQSGYNPQSVYNRQTGQSNFYQNNGQNIQTNPSLGNRITSTYEIAQNGYGNNNIGYQSHQTPNQQGMYYGQPDQTYPNYENNSPKRQQQRVQRIESYHQNQGQNWQKPKSSPLNDRNGQQINYGGFRQQLNNLQAQNQYLRENFNIDNPNQYNAWQNRLEAAERKAGQYRRQMEKWRSQAQKRGDYPGLIQLLDDGQKLRQQTLKYLKSKHKNSGYNQNYQREEDHYRSKYQGSRKAGGKNSFETNAISPNREYQKLVDGRASRK